MVNWKTILTSERCPVYLSFLEFIALVIQTQRRSGKAFEIYKGQLGQFTFKSQNTTKHKKANRKENAVGHYTASYNIIPLFPCATTATYSALP